MKKANLHEAKTQLSKLVEMCVEGEDVVICKAGKPVARLIPFVQKKIKRKPGGWEGKVKISDDFNELPKTFLKNFK
jgi:prevent-host-death family protein